MARPAGRPNAPIPRPAPREPAPHPRKPVPTNHERLVWGPGDGSGLHAIETPIGRIGGLICWENYMPLARFALYETGVEIYVASPADGADGAARRPAEPAAAQHVRVDGGDDRVGGPGLPPRGPPRDPAAPGRQPPRGAPPRIGMGRSGRRPAPRSYTPRLCGMPEARRSGFKKRTIAAVVEPASTRMISPSPTIAAASCPICSFCCACAA